MHATLCSLFLSYGMKISKLDHWSMESLDYNLTFVHIKGTDNILVDAIHKLKILEIYTEPPLDNPKTSALSHAEECIAEVVAKKYKP